MFSWSDAGIQDCAVVQELLKEVAQSHTLDPTGQKDFKGTHNPNVSDHNDSSWFTRKLSWFQELVYSVWVLVAIRDHGQFFEVSI